MIIAVYIIAMNGQDIVREFQFSRIFWLKFGHLLSGSLISFALDRQFRDIFFCSRWFREQNYRDKGSQSIPPLHLGNISNERLRWDCPSFPFARDQSWLSLSKSWSSLWGWRKPDFKCLREILAQEARRSNLWGWSGIPLRQRFTVTSERSVNGAKPNPQNSLRMWRFEITDCPLNSNLFVTFDCCANKQAKFIVRGDASDAAETRTTASTLGYRKVEGLILKHLWYASYLKSTADNRLPVPFSQSGAQG